MISTGTVFPSSPPFLLILKFKKYRKVQKIRQDIHIPHSRSSHYFHTYLQIFRRCFYKKPKSPLTTHLPHSCPTLLHSSQTTNVRSVSFQLISKTFTYICVCTCVYVCIYTYISITNVKYCFVKNFNSNLQTHCTICITLQLDFPLNFWNIPVNAC